MPDTTTDGPVATSEEEVSFNDPDDRDDEMHSMIEQWVRKLVDGVTDARASEAFDAWLDVQSRFHDYSHRNTLLITLQCPEATRVAGYRTWQEEFDRQVQEGESAIWIWAPIITTRCPECENSSSYHDSSDCEYDETDPEEWDKGLVGFRPVPVFDISQTEGEPLPNLETGATGDAAELVPTLLETALKFSIDVEVVEPAAWTYGDAKGNCTYSGDQSGQAAVEVRNRMNRADLAVTLIHEYAHAKLHGGVDDPERAKRELEAEAVAAIVGRYFDLDTSGSEYYLAAWHGENPEEILDRLDRISRTAEIFILAVEEYE
ncbi:ArdC-like ssDNA-binding domain-containing protein [Halorarum salinum]|uniref:DUF955 domain-containing protein n=1 Tax=Halorarum salinum TaxID=2743089 RepID=A0A7D5Q8Z6_9EURY|nr:ArdC-like ssDNA-binding domain-containing protein [Halobaculum salinum]QLG60299.1 DUF955 domain-containing protein [Halobaculum salinum]